MTAVAEATETKHQLRPSRLRWHDIATTMSAVGGGSSPVATAADTVTQQPDRHQCLFLLESGTLSETDGRTDGDCLRLNTDGIMDQPSCDE